MTMLDLITGESLGKITYALAALVGFVMAFGGFALFKGILPKDQGRKFAHNGALSEGKPRGAGIILISSFVFSTILLVKLDLELIIYPRLQQVFDFDYLNQDRLILLHLPKVCHRNMLTEHQYCLLHLRQYYEF